MNKYKAVINIGGVKDSVTSDDLKDLQNKFIDYMRNNDEVSYLGASAMRLSHGNITDDGKKTDLYFAYNGKLVKGSKKSNKYEIIVL